MSWASATSPISSDDRALAPRRRRRTRSTRCRRSRWRPGSTAPAERPRGRRSTARRRGSASRTRRTASRGRPAIPRGSGRRGALTARRPEPGSKASPAAPSAARQAASHSGSAGMTLARGHAVEQRPRGCVHPHPDDRVRVMPDGVGIDRDLGGVESGQPGPQRLGRRQVPGADHELRPVPVGELRIAQQQVVVGDGGRSVARAREGIGEQRDAGPRREARQLAGGGGVALGAGHDHDAAERVAPAGGSAGGRRIERDVRTVVAPGARVLGERGVEHERLAEREVQVDRTRRDRAAAVQ